MNVNTFQEDCRAQMKWFAENNITFDSIVTDPPYHIESIVKRFGKTKQSDNTKTSEDARNGSHQFARLSKNFMGQDWDAGKISFEADTWKLAFDILKPGGYLLAFNDTRSYHKMAWAIEQAGFEVRDTLTWLYSTGFAKNHEQFNGQGTQLTPCQELICMARKPFKGTIKSNIIKHGTGAINIEPCRLESGRHPGNVLHDGGDEVLQVFNKYGESIDRFFYSAKASKEEKEDYNNHPTVKPIALMRYLLDMVTPEGGVVLDPFMGSGSTGVASVNAGYGFYGIEKSREYHAIAVQRIGKAIENKKTGEQNVSSLW